MKTIYMLFCCCNRLKTPITFFALILIIFIFFTPSLLTAQQTNFFQGTNMLTPGNYSLGSLPTSSNDILLTSITPSLTISTANLTGQSINVTNVGSYTIGDGGSAARVLTLGNTVFTNAVSGIPNDLIYLSNLSSLSIQQYNGGTGKLSLSIPNDGNFNISTGSTLTEDSAVISGAAR